MPLTSDSIVLTTITAASVAAAVIDLRTRRVPNVLTFTLGAFGVALALTGLGRIGLTASLAGGLVGLLLMLPGHVFGRTGAGDVKLLAAGGTLLGPAATVTAFLVMAVAGGAIALVIAVRSRRVRGVEFAYAPAVAVGITLAALAG